MRGLFFSASNVNSGAGVDCRIRGAGGGGGISLSGLAMPLMRASRWADSCFLRLAASSTESASSWRRTAKAMNDRKIASWISRFGSLCVFTLPAIGTGPAALQQKILCEKEAIIFDCLIRFSELEGTTLAVEEKKNAGDRMNVASDRRKDAGGGRNDDGRRGSDAGGGGERSLRD